MIKLRHGVEPFISKNPAAKIKFVEGVTFFEVHAEVHVEICNCFSAQCRKLLILNLFFCFLDRLVCFVELRNYSFR